MERLSNNWRSFQCRWLVVLAILITRAVLAVDDPAQRLLVIYNENCPDSKPLATYYMERRHIPKDHLVGLHVRDAETITRLEYNEQVRGPILQFLLDHGLIFQLPQTVGKTNRTVTFDNKIDCLALMYGVPLRIEEDKSLPQDAPANIPEQARRNEASVDSELTVLPSPNTPLSGWLMNPFFNSPHSKFGSPLNNFMMLVARLDGPDPDTVRRMIDDAVAVERRGLLGRCYFDARDTQDENYKVGDRWIKDSYKLFQAAGYECDLENTERLYPVGYPMTDAAVYAGWYSNGMEGPFLREDFHFRHGAVAYHLHSSSAAIIHTRVAYWVGPLLAKGAAASAGHVFEPYLAGTPHLDLFFKRLLDGATFAEAGWYSEMALSWQTTFAGDPLYRPFAVPVDEQITRMEIDQHPDLEWAYLRKINLMIAQGDLARAEQLCRNEAEKLKSGVLTEKLGDLLHSSKRESDAVTEYQAALKSAGDAYQGYRISMKLAAAYESNQQLTRALAVYEGLLNSTNKAGNAQLILQKARDTAKLAGLTDKAESLQEKLEALQSSEKIKKN